MLNVDAAFLDAIFGFLARRRGLALAVSGGSDSMALMGLAALWRDHAPHAPMLRVASVDHGLRPESRLEAEGAGACAQRLGLAHEILTWTGDKPASGLQAAARKARYHLLAAWARAENCDVIVTAHHADDQAETILMRLTAGSGPAGLAGMSALAPCPGAPEMTIGRPLLGLTRAQLAQWRRKAGLPAFEDPSNADLKFRRPQLRALADRLAREGLDRDALLRLGARAARAESALALAAEVWADDLAAVFDDAAGGSCVARERLKQAPPEFLTRFLLREIPKIAGKRPRLHQAEAAASALLTALTEEKNLTLTLGKALLRLDRRSLTLRPEARTSCETPM